MRKNVAGQKAFLFAFDSTTNLPKTGDAANLTGYVSKDHGAVTALNDVAAAELDATNAPGYYWLDLTQGETNADTLLFTGKSSTANIVVIGAPAVVYTATDVFDGGITRAKLAADTGMQTIRSGTAQSGGANHIQLDAGASAVDDIYVAQQVYITGGAGAGQARSITAYNGANKTASIDVNLPWIVNPDATSTFAIRPHISYAGGGTIALASNVTQVNNPVVALATMAAGGISMDSFDADALDGVDAILAIIGGLTWVRNVLEADVEIDSATAPWNEVTKEKGTATELIRKKLRKVGGADVASTDDVIGSAREA